MKDKLFHNGFKENDVRPIFIVIANALVVTIIAGLSTQSIEFSEIYIKQFLMALIINIMRYLDLSIFLKIVLSLCKRKITFSHILNKTCVIMVVGVTLRVLTHTIVYYAELDIIIDYIITYLSVLSITGYSFLLLRQVYRLNLFTSIFLTILYLFICINQIIPFGVAMIIDFFRHYQFT